jgi:hypothetical protein
MSDCECTCLRQYDESLPHYEACECAGANADDTDFRCLAELAAYRDLDTALYVLSSDRNNRFAPRGTK